MSNAEISLEPSEYVEKLSDIKELAYLAQAVFTYYIMFLTWDILNQNDLIDLNVGNDYIVFSDKWRCGVVNTANVSGVTSQSFVLEPTVGRFDLFWFRLNFGPKFIFNDFSSKMNFPLKLHVENASANRPLFI